MLKHSENKFEVHLPQNSNLENTIKTEINSVQPTNILECLNCIQTTLSSKLPAEKLQDKTPIYRIVLQEFCDLCEIYVNVDHCRISPDLDEITLIITDPNNRKHELLIGVDYTKSNSEIFYVKQQNLPESSFKIKYSISLKEIYDKFLQIIRSLQYFWNVMDELDRNFWILDPEIPKRSDVHRRIVLGLLKIR